VSTRLTGSFFDKGFQAGEGLVPLLGDEVEIFAERNDGFGVELEEVFAAGMDAANEAGGFQNAKMLGNGLACKAEATRQLRDGTRAPAVEAGNERQTSGIAESGKY